MKSVDIIGKRFGRLFVVDFDHADGYRKYYQCICDCGNMKVVLKGNLLAGRTTSCGCYQKERASEASSLPPHYRRLRSIFRGMKSRCYDEKCSGYKRYGGRGISICDEWLNNIDSFCKWALDNGYEDGLSIDRIDNDGDYCPSNCRWATPSIQMSNYSRNVLIEYNGEKKTMSQWAEEYGIRLTTLHNRLRYLGWSIDKALNEPVIQRNYARSTNS